MAKTYQTWILGIERKIDGQLVWQLESQYCGKGQQTAAWQAYHRKAKLTTDRLRIFTASQFEQLLRQQSLRVEGGR